MARDGFTKLTSRVISARVGSLCSNPHCKRITSGPNSADAQSINIGIAAHITAASPGGPRYDESLSERERKYDSNGIWLCSNCAKLVDSDVVLYPVKLLKDWKILAEQAALASIESRRNPTREMLLAEGVAIGSAELRPLDWWPDHWKTQRTQLTRLYLEGEEPAEASLDELIERAKGIQDSDLVRGFTVVRDLLHALSDFDRPAPPLIPTDDFPSDLRTCYETCHEIYMCLMIVLMAIGLPYGYIYDSAERERMARVLARIWTKLAVLRTVLPDLHKVFLQVSDKSTQGVTAHQTIEASAEFVIREIVSITEMNWSVTAQLEQWKDCDDVPFSAEKLIEHWPEVFRKLHISKQIDVAHDESRAAFSGLAVEAARAFEHLSPKMT